MKWPLASFPKLNIFLFILGARKVIDIGVFTGASSLAAALALRDLDPSRDNGSVVLACDVNDEYTRIAEKFWEKAGVREYVKLQIAPAAETLQV